MNKPDAESQPDPLREGLDFYWDSGLMVLTEKFLKARGYCCESNCRHCPYGFGKTPAPADE